MGDSNAERQRRYRAHKRGDHALCDSARCEDLGGASVTSPVTAVTRNAVTPSAPPHLGTRGRRLWRELHAAGAPGPAESVLLEEACRIADRLDRLDALLRGDIDTWATVRVNLDTGTVAMIINSPMAEARQLTAVLKQVCAELRQSAGKATAGGPAQQEASALDQLAARRKKRLAEATGS